MSCVRSGGTICARDERVHAARSPDIRSPVRRSGACGRRAAISAPIRRSAGGTRSRTLCRDPELSARVALASIEDFDFDAAILFSDLLFPLDAIGLGLTLRRSRAANSRTGSTADMLDRCAVSLDAIAADLAFQAEAVRATRRQLPADKGLIGFVGGPWTLFVYAVEGTHSDRWRSAKSSMPLYRRFARAMVPVLERVIARAARRPAPTW